MPSYRTLLPLSLVLLAGCAGQTKPVVTLEDASDCKPLKLHTGQELVLILPSNPTTGFRWELRNAANGLLRAWAPRSTATPKTQAWSAAPANLPGAFA